MLQRQRLLENWLSARSLAAIQLWGGEWPAESPSYRQLQRRLALRHVRRWAVTPRSDRHQPHSQSIRTAQRQHSMTHSGSRLFAIGIRRTKEHTKRSRCEGIGIDFECWKLLTDKHRRIMLTPHEHTGLPRTTSNDLLRLWTVKEACYKADNREAKKWVLSYELLMPSAHTGIARVKHGWLTRKFKYTSKPTRDGMLSVAVAL